MTTALPGNSSTANQIAAIDLGSNSFHLLLAQVVEKSIQPLVKNKLQVRLAEGLDEQGLLSEEAMARGLQAIEMLVSNLKQLPENAMRIVATHTLRKASNSKAFIKRAEVILPFPVEVIPGTEEARLVYLGVAHTSSLQGRRLVVDIGGGSTEFALGEGFVPELLRSVNMGCVSYTKRYFADGTLSRKNFSAAMIAAGQKLEPLIEHFEKRCWDVAIGTSGTARSLFALCQTLEPGTQAMTVNLLQDLRKQLIRVGQIEKIAFKDIRPERAAVLPGGLAILEAIMTGIGIRQMTISNTALCEGILYDLAERMEHRDIRQRSIESLQSRYHADHGQADRVEQMAMDLLRQCAGSWKLDRGDYRQLLSWAAEIHEVGLQINTRNYHKHSAYIAANAELPGFNQEQQAALSWLLRYSRKRLKPDQFESIYHYPTDRMLRLLRILRLSLLLHGTRLENHQPVIECSVKNEEMCLSLPAAWAEQNPILVADLATEKKNLKALGFDLTLRFNN